MHLKLTRNIGRADLKAFGLVTDDKDMNAALAKYCEGSVHDFDKEVGEALVKRGLAGEDDGVPPPQMRGVAKPAAITAPVKAETFKDNPHEPAPKKDK